MKNLNAEEQNVIQTAYNHADVVAQHLQQAQQAAQVAQTNGHSQPAS